MLINIEHLVDGQSLSVNEAGNIVLPENYDNREVPFKLEGTLSCSGSDYILNAKVECSLNLACDLCLENFTKDISFDLKETFSKIEDEGREIWHIQDKKINLSPIILTGIISHYPMRNVCSETCKGLCTKCGHNLNKGDCGCDRFVPDPRLEIFKTLLNDKEV